GCLAQRGHWPRSDELGGGGGQRPGLGELLVEGVVGGEFRCLERGAGWAGVQCHLGGGGLAAPLAGGGPGGAWRAVELCQGWLGQRRAGCRVCRSGGRGG